MSVVNLSIISVLTGRIAYILAVAATEKRIRLYTRGESQVCSSLS
jgi:hypothetical protein